MDKERAIEILRPYWKQVAVGCFGDLEMGLQAAGDEMTSENGADLLLDRAWDTNETREAAQVLSPEERRELAMKVARQYV
jgi:hypothetical protein